MRLLKDKRFISPGLAHLAVSAQLSASLNVCVCVHYPYSPVWSTPLPVSSVRPSQYSWLVAYEETLTLPPHVADEYVTIALYPLSTFSCMAGIYVFSEAFGLRSNLYDNTYTSGGSMIDIWGIFLFFFLIAPYLRVNTNDRQQWFT